MGERRGGGGGGERGWGGGGAWRRGGVVLDGRKYLPWHTYSLMRRRPSAVRFITEQTD